MIQDTFIKANWRKLAFNMIWLMEILRIWLEEKLPIKYYVINHLLLLKIKNLMDIQEVLLQCYNFFDKRSSGGTVKSEIMS